MATQEVEQQHQAEALTNCQDDLDVEIVEVEAAVEQPEIEELHIEEANAELQSFKHPLEHVWTLWYLENDRSKSWKEMQNEITSLDTVEDFWSLYYTIKTPSELRVGSDYSMFKRGIKPMWEDEANKEGGRWLITVNKVSKGGLDKLWLDILLMMIGEIFEHPAEICGAVVNIRGKNNKISIWTAHAGNSDAVLEIGNKVKMLLHLQPHILQYQLHSDAMSKQSSAVKSVYTL